MAEHTLETRILLRYGTYGEWMNSNVILKQGEAAIAIFPYQNTLVTNDIHPANTPPAVGIKIGDGQHYFHELPWVQAIAADVYSWAKDSVKPVYTAQEIYGLQNFVENLISGDVEVNIAPRMYSLVKGTGANANKYYLQYKENDENSQWIIDTSQSIDLTDLVTILNWINPNDLQNYDSLAGRTESHIQIDLARLSLTDSDDNSSVVTSVSQNKGKVSITKRTLNFNNISGTLGVEKGGTGATTFPSGEALIGSDQSAIRTVPVDSDLTNTQHLVYSSAIKSYIDHAVEGLSGAMHFIGDAGVVITPNSSVDPRIPGYNFSQAQSGDVILYDQKEFVWAGGSWRLLGDEGSYAVKGSIKDIDIAADAAIQQSKIANLDTTFNTKVDKVEGKSLTSNDFTDELKQKLENIEDGATRNSIEHILVNGTETAPTTVGQLNNAVNLTISEFTDAAQLKLSNIEENAEVNTIEKIIYNGTEMIPNENRVVTITPDPHTEHENKIEQIFINGVEWIPNQNKQVRITIDQAALNLNVLEGATIPDNQGGTTEVNQVSKKLQLGRIAITENVSDLKQTNDTYIILNCGSSTEVI